MKPRILFIPTQGAVLLEMLPIATRILSDEQFEPLFFVFQNISQHHLNLIQQKEISMIGPLVSGYRNLSTSKIPNGEIRSPDLRTKFRLKWKTILGTTNSLSVISFIWNLLKNLYLLQQAAQIIKKESVVAVVTVGDRHVGWETAFLKIAKQRSIPSLIVPYAMSHPNVVASLRVRQKETTDQYRVNTLTKRVFSQIYPNWVYKFGEEELFYLPLSNSLAAKIVGIMPENPWTLGGGVADRMAVENNVLYHMFLAQGVDATKMIVTGKPSVDQIFQSLKSKNIEEERNRLKIPKSNRVLLLSVPQLGEHGFLPMSQHMRAMDELIGRLSSLSKVSLILSLHPKSNPTDYLPISEKYGAILSSLRIYDLLPLCDVFISEFSSIVMSAIGVRKPTVIINFYGMNRNFYDNAPGVIILWEQEYLESLIERLMGDQSYYDNLAEEQRCKMSDWILLDGKCTQRVLDELYKLISSRSKKVNG